MFREARALCHALRRVSIGRGRLYHRIYRPRNVVLQRVRRHLDPLALVSKQGVFVANTTRTREGRC